MRISDWISDVCSSDLLEPASSVGVPPRLCHTRGGTPTEEAGSRCLDQSLTWLSRRIVANAGSRRVATLFNITGVEPVGCRPASGPRYRPGSRPCCPAVRGRVAASLAWGMDVMRDVVYASTKHYQDQKE